MKLNEKNARFAVVKTACHNGGVLSFHINLTAAEKKASDFRGDCKCGCCEVVPITEEAREEMWHTENKNQFAYPKYPYRLYLENITEMPLLKDIPEYDPDMHYGTICK